MSDFPPSRMPRIIWRAATARTGGTLLTQLAEDMLTRAGHSFHPIGPDDIESNFDLECSPPAPTAALQARLGEDIWTGGRDSWFTEAFRHPIFRLLFVRRDLREAAASHRRFTNSSIEDTLALLGRWVDIHFATHALPPERVLMLDYDDILRFDPAARSLAAFLEIDLDDAALDDLRAMYSKSSVADRLARARERIFIELRRDAVRAGQIGGLRLHLLNGHRYEEIDVPMDRFATETRDAIEAGTVTELVMKLPDCGEIVIIANRGGDRFRIYSMKDLLPGHFQLDHVVAYETPAWQDAFNDHEIEKIERITAPMRRDLGY